MRALTFTALSLSLLTACSRDVIVGVDREGDIGEPDSEISWIEESLEQMDQAGGCGDAWVQVWSEEAEFGMELFREGLIARAIEAGEPVRETVEIGVDELEMVLQYASPISANYCTDTPTDEREVHMQWVALEGSVVFQTTPPEVEGGDATIELDLWNVVLLGDNGEEVLIRRMEIEGIQVNPAWGG